MDVWLINAAHVNAVPGRKTDVGLVVALGQPVGAERAPRKGDMGYGWDGEWARSSRALAGSSLLGAGGRVVVSLERDDGTVGATRGRSATADSLLVRHQADLPYWTGAETQLHSNRSPLSPTTTLHRGQKVTHAPWAGTIANSSASARDRL
jgi:hypothetical protein